MIVIDALGRAFIWYPESITDPRYSAKPLHGLSWLDDLETDSDLWVRFKRSGVSKMTRESRYRKADPQVKLETILATRGRIILQGFELIE